MTASRIISRRVLKRHGDHYVGTVPIFGFEYHVTLRKADGGVEMEVRDRPPDADAPTGKQLGTGKYWTDGGFAKDLDK